MTDFAIHYHPEAYSLSGKVMGRQSAGTAFLRAVSNYNPAKLWCYASSRDEAKSCAQTLANNKARTGVAWIPLDQPGRLTEPGLLYRPDPVIDQEAWRRLAYSNPRAYSLCGITHTIASQGPMTVLANLPSSPLEPWDAIICTSRAVRDSVRSLVETQMEFLRSRTGATHFTLPQLPLIPLGVHCEDFENSSELRASTRTAYGIEPDEIVVLFVGRLSFHGKAHPAPLYLALEACAKQHRVTLLQAGWFANDFIEKAFRDDAQALCPSVRFMHVDARDQKRLKDLWAIGDIFTSLSDNIQETFGLTPIEAMAAGLPVVVSDWDGYRDTVRHEIDGFRISTLSLPPGAGSKLADQFDLGTISYDMYCGYASQLVAINVPETESAFRRLMDDPALRTRMGEAGKRRALECFDWSVIFRRYIALWDELGERRRADPGLINGLSPTRRPDKPDPFSLFATYPTYQINSTIELRIIVDDPVMVAQARRKLGTISFASSFLPPDEILRAALLSLSKDRWTQVAEIRKRSAPLDERSFTAALTWLAKVGVIEFREAGTTIG